MTTGLDRNESISNASVLVTGATGFIGRELVRKLVENGQAVRALSRSGLAASQVEGIAAEITDIAALRAAMEGVNVVYHLAGVGSPSSPFSDLDEIYQVNVVGTLNVMDAARLAGVRRVVVASSAAVYGATDSPAISEDSALAPVNPYGLTKVAQEQTCEMYSRVHGIQTVALRLFNVYGPGEDLIENNRKLIPGVLRKLLVGEPIQIYGNGCQTRDFIYIDDVVRAFIASAYFDLRDYDVINVGTGTGVAIKDVVEMMASAIGKVPTLDHQLIRQGDTGHSVADISRAKQRGIFPEVSFEDGIRKFMHPEPGGAE